MSGFWGVFWLAVVLKIPIVALLLIVWWAIREPPVPEADEDEGDEQPGVAFTIESWARCHDRWPS